MRKAWEREYDIIRASKPYFEKDDNELFWEEQQSGPEEVQDVLTKVHYHSQVPGSRAHESICNAAIQATENKGYIVENGMELLEKGLKAIEDGDMVLARQCEFEIFEACNNAKKDETSPYWNQTFYDSFEEYEKVVNFPKFEVDIDSKYDAFLAAWTAQVVGGAFGTCIEGYMGKTIREKYGEDLCSYVRKPNTYNDDITYELALIFAYKEKGKATTAKDIAREWVVRIPSGWSAEEWALNNLKAGVMPPYSGKVNNPFNEWIGAQMRGVICGQLYPGDLKEAARCAWMDASISHDRNGILGEVFNALMASYAFAEKDVRKILKDCIDLIPVDSEYGQVIRFAYEQCLTHDDFYEAWLPCEEKYKKYNWIHAYPNACAEVVALYFGEGDFNKTVTCVGGCGQDVDCNAAQILSIVATIGGTASIPEYWTNPFGDDLKTYIRGLKQISLKELAKITLEIAKNLH